MISKIIQRSAVTSVIASSLLLCTTTLAQASDFAIDQLTVTKNGTVILDDTFDNGDTSSGNNFSNGNTSTYTSAGNALPSTETGGKVLLDPYAGKIITSGLTGDPIYFNQATLNTNASNSTTKLNKGLKDDDTFKVRALFDLVEPTDYKERFGLRLTDRGTGNGSIGNVDIVEVDVKRVTSGVIVEFREQDRPNAKNNVFDKVVLSYASFGMTESTFAMYDQIALQLERATTTSDITASFTLVDSSGTATDYTHLFSGSAKIFEGERFTRAEYISVAPATVPEASTLLLFGLGLLGLFGARTKKYL